MIGSKLYQTFDDNSDTDYLRLYNIGKFTTTYFPNIHQFQYKDVENNIDYIWTNHTQFWKNLQSGDSTINADLICFSNFFVRDKEQKLLNLRTYKVIKAYLGFAKRDLQAKTEKKFKHAIRSIYMAEELLQWRLPTLEGIQLILTTEYTHENAEAAKFKLETLRGFLANEYNQDLIPNYYIDDFIELLDLDFPENTLFTKLLQSNNTKEFKYV